MLKAILLFIKAHAVATAITTTVVVGTAVAAPVAVNNYILDKEVKSNLSMLAPSNFQSESNNKEDTKNNETSSNNQIIEDKKPTVNENEPLTFRIEKTYSKKEGGDIVKDMQGNDVINQGYESVSFNIVPSYDKDYSKWTNEEKRAYQKALEEVRKMGEEYFNENREKEEQAIKDIEQLLNKIENSYSKDYSFAINKRKYGNF